MGTVGAALERRRRRRVALGLAVFMLAVVAWVLFVPVNAYLERNGRVASCGSVRDPEPNNAGDDSCVDELRGREALAYGVGALSGLLFLGVAATTPALTARFRSREALRP